MVLFEQVRFKLREVQDCHMMFTAIFILYAYFHYSTFASHFVKVQLN